MSALIYGISGQDGAYQAELLLRQGYEVWGASRDAAIARRENLRRLGIAEQVKTFGLICSEKRGLRPCKFGNG